MIERVTLVVTLFFCIFRSLPCPNVKYLGVYPEGEYQKIYADKSRCAGKFVTVEKRSHDAVPFICALAF